jgi:hypothetical protein
LGDPSSIFILTFLSPSVQFNTIFNLVNNTQPCNIDLIAPNQFVLGSTTYYGNFFSSSLTINSFIQPTIHGGLYCNDTLAFDTFNTFPQVFPCICQLPSNQFDQCTPQITHKQIIYNVKCSNSLTCSP